MLSRAPLLVFSLLSACTEVRFEGTGGAGAGGASGGAGATTSTSSSSGAAGSGAGGTGGGDCIPEVCDGLDNDCNGVADDPLAGSGSFCDCEWLSYAGKLYVACPTTAAFDDLVCPLGTELVVLQSATEQEALGPLVPEDSSAFVGLRQVDGASSPAAGWNWVGGVGMPPAWDVDQPNDLSYVFAESVENDRQQCGFLARQLTGEYGLADGLCDGELNTRVLCEHVSEDCVDDAPCTLGSGCNGELTCGDAPACNAIGEDVETCNGLDDDCDAVIGNDSCACTEFESTTGRKYKTCATLTRPSDAECGEGFRLAVPNTPEEFTFLKSTLSSGVSGERWIGGFQTQGSATPDAGWVMLDGSALVPGQWDAGEPSDDDDIESGGQDCLFLDPSGLRDGYCPGVKGALCEQIP